jgi:hypothetical protein
MTASLSMQTTSAPPKLRRRRVGRCGRCDRHGDREAAAVSEPGAHGDRMVEHPGDAVDDRQAEPEAPAGIGLGLEAMKFLEDIGEAPLRNTGAGIPDIDAQRRAAPAAADQNAPPHRVAQRIGKEILQDAAQQSGIAAHCETRGDHAEADAALARDRGEFLVEGGQYRVDGKG